MPRLVLVYNPNSSKFCHVKKDILNRREELFAKYTQVDFTIKKIGFDNNVKELAKIVKDDDLVLALGGDATAAITANAILKSDKNATLAVLPYGNFNDLARTLKTMRLEDLNVCERTCATNGEREERPSPVTTDARECAANKSFKSSKLYPLEIYINGKFWRYATCYVTIGMTAESVELFDEPKFRKHMQKGHKSSISSYFKLAKWYFENRHKKEFLPEFTVNGEKSAKGASDYAAVSGRSMCRVMRGGKDFLKPKVFRSKTAKLTSFPKLVDLMMKSMFYRVPGKETRGDTLEFKTPATVELQAEGEYQTFENVKTIEIKKGDKCLQVIQNL